MRRAPLLTLVVFVCVFWVCLIDGSALLHHWTVSSSFHVSVPFHPLQPVHFKISWLTCILWLCSNETWHQRWQRSLKSWQATGQVSVCAQCNNLKCVLSGRLCGYCDGLTLKIQFYIALFYFLKLLKCGRNFNWRSPWKILIWVDYFCLESGIQMLSFVSSTSSKN